MSGFWASMVEGSPWSWFVAVPMGLLLLAAALGVVAYFVVSLWEGIFPPIEQDKWLYRGKAVLFLFFGSIVVGMIGTTVAL